MYLLVAIIVCWQLPSCCDSSCHANMMAVAILSVWQLPYCHYGSCHIVIMAVAILLWSGCHAWIKLCYKQEFTQRSGKINTIKCSRQPFWYILFLKASWRKSTINLHQFMFFTFFRFACTTQNFRAKSLPHQKSNGKKNNENTASH